MSFEIKCHTVRCLKALCNGFDIYVRQQHDGTFRWFHTYMKLGFLLHTEAIGPYSSSETVHGLLYIPLMALASIIKNGKIFPNSPEKKISGLTGKKIFLDSLENFSPDVLDTTLALVIFKYMN